MSETIALGLDTDSYLSDTTNLSTLEHGAYLLILMTLWRSKAGWIDGGDVYLSRATRMTLGRWKRIAPTIRLLLVRDEKGKVSQKRLLKEHRKLRLSPQETSLGENPNSQAKSLKNNDPISETPIQAQNPPDPPLLLTEEVKKVESPRKKNKGSVIPENWTAREAERDYGRQRGLSEAEIDQAAEQMKRWGIANGHREIARKSNWDLTFRNWLDGFIERKHQRGSHETNRGNSSRRSFAGYAAELRYGAAGAAAEGATGDRESIDRRSNSTQRLV